MGQSGGSNQKPPNVAAEAEVEFNEIEFRRREPVAPLNPEAAEKPYRIYKSRTEFVEIVATSAKEAMEKTGVKHPKRIVRMDLERAAVLPPSFLKMRRLQQLKIRQVLLQLRHRKASLLRQKRLPPRRKPRRNTRDFV